jgi:hypothetical protein
MFVMLAFLSIVVYLTGSPASHQMRELPGIARETIHQHSSVAAFAFWTMEVLGALSLGALVRFRHSTAIPGRLMTALLALAFLVMMILMIWTASLGGRIRHSEIGASSATRQTWTA